MINKLALGTVQFGLDYGISNKAGQIKYGDVLKILTFAHQSGITTIDTAKAYGNSEEVIGDSLVDTKSHFDIITKISAKEDVKGQTESSLKALKCKKLYGVLFHDTNDALLNISQIERLIEFRKSGQIEKVGFSLYAPEQLERLFENNIDFNLVQLPYNILDQRFKRYFDELKGRNIEIHARSLFLQGVFFMDPNDLEPKFDELKPNLMKLRYLINEINLPYSSIPLCFGLLEESIDKLVIGVESLDNLKENIDSINYIDSVKKIISELRNLESNDSKMILPTNWK